MRDSFTCCPSDRHLTIYVASCHEENKNAIAVQSIQRGPVHQSMKARNYEQFTVHRRLARFISVRSDISLGRKIQDYMEHRIRENNVSMTFEFSVD